jgi:hypothetical protein
MYSILDADGLTNGEELGDPDCIWVVGKEPSFPARSHPGIFTNTTDNQDVPLTDTCANYKPPSDVMSLDLKFQQPNSLDGRRTQYVCEQFMVQSPLEDVEDFHQIKTEPLLDNEKVLHHMIIYNCEDTQSSDGDKINQGPYECDGVEANCFAIAGWAVGETEYCEPQYVGSELWFGSWERRRNYATIKIEAHYDNPLGQIGVTDRSGIRLHVTPTLRPLSSADVILGMTYWDRQFQLPAQQSSVQKTNICPSEATSRLKRPIYVYAWYPHMHLYGRSLRTEQYRCGVKIGEIRMDQFEFDNQQSYSVGPMKILPGDALVTTCTFDTTTASSTVLGGDETTDEMCENYLTYYPGAYTDDDPDFFTSCNSFEEGENPTFVDDDDGYDDDGYDDYSSFVMLDANGDVYLERYESDPAKNMAPCCKGIVGNGEACEASYLGNEGDACGVDSDCDGDIPCLGGLCGGRASSATTGGPSYSTAVQVLLLLMLSVMNVVFAGRTAFNEIPFFD